uniref:Uncharacterized protein n=1 Tax=Panagrolaimus superbus TaxID=310955 RepID=A0A914Y6Q9_9BILA
MNKMVQLYELSHKLIEMEPERESTYYAIGCYYYIAEQYGAARKFFHKSVSINPNFGYGWLAHGHALSFDKEHEQAMNCYLRASRLLENCAEPRLYTGIEYCNANNLKQAAQNIKSAAAFCETPNAVILHELGTVYLYDKDYDRK